MQLPLAFDLDGLADLFGEAQPQWTILAVMLALLLGAAVVALLREPVARRIHKRAGR